jgi:hypothetical protein
MKNEISRAWVEEKYLPENTELIRVMDFVRGYIRDFSHFTRQNKGE